MPFAGYTELNALAPEEFLNWEQFTTPFDNANNHAYRKDQYQKGLEIGARSLYVSISCGSTWGASGKDGSSTSSYCGIGYHAGTADLLRGFLDSGVPIKVYRYDNLPEGVWIVGAPDQAPTPAPERNPRISTTYSVVTNESAAEGDTAENGWENEKGVSMLPVDCVEEEGLTTVDLAVEFLQNHGACEPSASFFHVGVWYDGSADQDYSTGDYRTESYHLKGFTPEEEAAIYRRLFPQNS